MVGLDAGGGLREDVRPPQPWTHHAAPRAGRTRGRTGPRRRRSTRRRDRARGRHDHPCGSARGPGRLTVARPTGVRRRDGPRDGGRGSSVAASARSWRPRHRATVRVRSRTAGRRRARDTVDTVPRPAPPRPRTRGRTTRSGPRGTRRLRPTGRRWRARSGDDVLPRVSPSRHRTVIFGPHGQRQAPGARFQRPPSARCANDHGHSCVPGGRPGTIGAATFPLASVGAHRPAGRRTSSVHHL